MYGWKSYGLTCNIILEEEYAVENEFKKKLIFKSCIPKRGLRLSNLLTEYDWYKTILGIFTQFTKL